MITTVNLNPCIDKTVYLENFEINALNRVVSTRTDPSGKGINVGIVVKQLGENDALCTGFNYSQNGNLLTDFLDSIDLSHEFVQVDGMLRTNTKILDTANNTFTELNESGGYVSKKHILELKEMIKKHGLKSDIVTLNGSVAKNVPHDIYKQLIEDLGGSNAKVILDAEGELLTQGLLARPYLIKPNLYELETAFHVQCDNSKDIIRLATKIIDKFGVTMVCISMGNKGAILTDGSKSFFSPPLDIQVKGYQGAGDSMVAGMCVALRRRLPLSDILRYGSAAAQGSLIREGTLLCTRESLETMLPRVAVSQIH